MSLSEKVYSDRLPVRQALTELLDADLERLILIREFELLLLHLFSQGKLNGTTHTCLGQEYIPVSVSRFLTEADFVFSNHRGHGHYLARFDDPSGLLAEIMGREGGICHGVGGSQHLYRDRQHLSTGIQGESLPVAVGVALHSKRSGSGSLAVAYIGDGTWGEGAVYEALNMAALWMVPLVVVVEHNKISQSTSTNLQLAGSIAGRARGFGIDHVEVRSVDVNEARAAISDGITKARNRCHPLVIEFDTWRIGPHSKGDDPRDVDELENIRKWDWHGIYAELFPEQFNRVARKVQARLEGVLQDVEARHPSSWDQR